MTSWIIISYFETIHIEIAELSKFNAYDHYVYVDRDEYKRDSIRSIDTGALKHEVSDRT